MALERGPLEARRGSLTAAVHFCGGPRGARIESVRSKGSEQEASHYAVLHEQRLSVHLRGNLRLRLREEMRSELQCDFVCAALVPHAEGAFMLLAEGRALLQRGEAFCPGHHHILSV